MNRRLSAAAAAVVAAASLAACSSGIPAASRIAPGSKVTPCPQIDGRIRALLPYYANAFAAVDTSRMYAAQVALANAIGGNVSNLDPPQALARAEVNFSVDVLDGGYVTRNQPFSPAVEDDARALAAACGIPVPGA